MKKITKTILALVAILATFASASAQNSTSYKIHKYVPNDGGILTDITPNGKWGIIRLGSTQAGGTATPKLYNIDTEEVIPVTYNNLTFDVASVSDDGNIVVGSIYGRPAAYDRAQNKIKLFPLRNLWQSGALTHVSPDGKWAVGSYNGFNGKLNEQDELNHDYYYSTLFVSMENGVETGDTVATPGLPKRDMSHLDQHAMKFNSITPDGRYIIGEMSWYIMQPIAGVVFIYDVQEHNYRVVGFKENDTKPWEPLTANLHHIESPSLSPDGHWLTGMAYIAKAQEGSQFFAESGVPFRYDVYTGDFTVFDESDLSVEGCAINNNGTIFGNPNTGGPLRDFRVFYQDKYWITLSQICKQKYDFSFTEKTGFERTGTVVATNSDASRIISFVDPLGESYCFDFGQPIEEVCNGIDLLDNYSISPIEGSVFSQLSSVEINFGRAVQVLGTGRNVHLYKADGTKVADGLTAGNQGLSLKTGSKTVVNAVFRTRVLEAGEKYYVSIDAGAIAVANDAQRVNKEIRINYVGRKSGPVEFVKASPESHSQLRQLDASSSYILLTFDSPVKLTENYSAYLERVEDGERVATLTMNEGNTEETKNLVLLYPSAAVNLYQGLEYKVVIAAGSVCDYSGSESSYNEEITINYHGTYMREVTNETVIFADDFSNISESLTTWLRYDGDHRTPLASMQAWEFDADNQPWNFSVRESNDNPDYFAASHSLYAPSGQSDDWMLTPQLIMPEDGKALLEFDAQSYYLNKKDTLRLLVFEEEFQLSYLNDAWMEDVRALSVPLAEIALSAGATQEKTSGEWTHYKFDLSKWAGKSIYIAFVNQNTNQSAIFVDNVVVQRELLYTIGFSNADRFVAKDDVTISGQFTVKSNELFHSISLTLKDAADNEVSKVEWPSISGSLKDRPIPFTFSKPLALVSGKENAFTIDVQMGDETDTYKGKILNLAFETTKHVVLEEMTGIDCGNCPQGILSIEKCEKAFGEQFIPISIHTYDSDPYASNLYGYSQFLGLIGSPMARINRLPGIFMPMTSNNGVSYDTYPEDPLWYDIVAQELNKLAPADLEVQAFYDRDAKRLDYIAEVRYALDADNQQLSLLLVVLEDGLVNYQKNFYGTATESIFGEWGAGGLNSGEYAWPVTHNDVARSVIGQKLSGTIGLFPTSFTADSVYTATLSSTFPQSVEDDTKVSVVAMLIDSQTGEVINANKTAVALREAEDPENAINDVLTDGTADADVYTLSGVLVRKAAASADLRSLPSGIYIRGGKKIHVR